jgi:hypothetical protein
MSGQSELPKGKTSSQSLLYARDPNWITMTKEAKRSYETSEETYYTKWYNNPENNPLGVFKAEILEHDSTYCLHLNTVLLILIFHRALQPFSH